MENRSQKQLKSAECFDGSNGDQPERSSVMSRGPAQHGAAVETTSQVLGRWRIGFKIA